MQMVSIEELKKNYPTVNDQSKGKCIIVPGAEFNPDWQPELEDQGFECFDDFLDNRPVTFIQLKISESEKLKESKLLRHQYTPEEDAYIKTLYNADKPLDEIGDLVHAKYPERSRVAVKKHIETLQANGTLSMRKNMPSARKYSEEEDKLLLDLLIEQGYNKSKILKKAIADGKFKDRRAPNLLARYEVLIKMQKANVKVPEQSTENDLHVSGNSHRCRCAFVKPVANEQTLEDKFKSLEERFELLSQAYSSLSNGYVELKTEVDKINDRLENDFPQYTYVDEVADEVRNDLAKHEHAKSGKVMVPLEAS